MLKEESVCILHRQSYYTLLQKVVTMYESHYREEYVSFTTYSNKPYDVILKTKLGWLGVLRHYTRIRELILTTGCFPMRIHAVIFAI